jgi:hypothetical protein
MNPEAINHYERAFASWLKENRVPFVRIDQSRREDLIEGRPKSFDFLLCPNGPRRLLVEVKGRTFHGVSLAGRKGLDCWITAEDGRAMKTWRRLFESRQTSDRAIFVFAFQLERIDTDPDGLCVYEFEGRRYVFFVISAADYLRRMKQRSPRWRTLTLSADDVRGLCVSLDEFMKEVCIG